MDKLDFKKLFPEYYAPKTTPAVIDIPPMQFIIVDGKGDPNTEGGEYQKAVQVLYSLSYAIKMGLKASSNVPEGYADYTVLPLEGLWWFGDGVEIDITKKDNYLWSSMIRQPDFITEEIFRAAKETVRRKKPELEVDKARLEVFREGLCVQVMHLGPYDEEPATVLRMEAHMKEQGYIDDIGMLTPEGSLRKHHEIYLSNPLTTAPSKMKTILRHPVRPVDR
jgi:hypothetical protein